MRLWEAAGTGIEYDDCVSSAEFCGLRLAQEIMTCAPSFYADTQRIFLSLFKDGLAYQGDGLVNWDPIDRTVLANEQVDVNGFSWRSGARVEQIKLKQWFIRITDYADRLLQDLEELEMNERWPSHVVAMQKSWLGKSEGAVLRFPLYFERFSEGLEARKHVEVFTTRADTLFGAQYIALSVDHPIVRSEADTNEQLQSFIEQSSGLPPDSKAGFRLPHVLAQNPLATLLEGANEFDNLPVYAAPYVRSDYGSGAVMGVPAHDERDHTFWKKHTDTSPRQVIKPAQSSDTQDDSGDVLTEVGYLTDVCGRYSGMHSGSAAKHIIHDLAAVDSQIAFSTVKWRLRDWLVSRQRYWGCPIPIIHCPNCGAVPVPEEDLPVTLPDIEERRWKGATGNPLEKMEDWVSTACPKCASSAQRETDTMDTFVDSSWYYLRFARSATKGSTDGSDMPVDIYIGGVEHAILHLLYARFINKYLLGPQIHGIASEPFQRLLTQGMVHGKTFKDPDTGRYLAPDDVEFLQPALPTVKSSGKTVDVSFEKMSKSKHNGVDPIHCMNKYGTDSTRAHLLFQAPPTEILEWDEEKIAGIERWLHKVWILSHDLTQEREPPHKHAYTPSTDQEVRLWKTVQSTIVSITRSLDDTFTLNTVVSDLMILTNEIQKYWKEIGKPKTDRAPSVLEHAMSILLRLMTPVAPSFSEECWEIFHNRQTTDATFSADTTASCAGFPRPDGSLEKLQARTQTCAVQINGKLKFTVEIPSPQSDLPQESLTPFVVSQVRKSATWLNASTKHHWSLEEAKKIIVARSGRILNIVF